MQIEGPFLIEVIDDESRNSRKVEVRFREDFQGLDTDQQCRRVESYIQHLYQLAKSLDQESADYQGVQLILPLCEQVLPYLADKSIDLTETISLEIDIGPASPQVYINLAKLNIN
jgi:hypothetical protein